MLRGLKLAHVSLHNRPPARRLPGTPCRAPEARATRPTLAALRSRSLHRAEKLPLGRERRASGAVPAT